MINSNNKYTQMQQKQYNHEASCWTPENRNIECGYVVGSFDKHNEWKDYDDFLFKNINTSDKIALDFGCGPCRNIVKFCDRFNRIDGTDLSQVNLDKGKSWCENNKVSFIPNLYKTNGVDLSNIESNSYDIVFSTICFQHICVHEIRYNLLQEFHRVLKSGGSVCIQMGYGKKHIRGVNYFDNYYDSLGTNSYQDVMIEDPDQVKTDLDKIGFKDFSYDLRPVGPGDGGHEQWIFFRATK